MPPKGCYAFCSVSFPVLFPKISTSDNFRKARKTSSFRKSPRSASIVSMTAGAHPSLASLGEDTSEGIELRSTGAKGEGVFATRILLPGETVLVGFILKDVAGNHSHATQVAADRWVQHGGLNSKLNHSCDPNCGVRLNTAGAFDFVARKEIQVDEELTFDYATRNYIIEHFPSICQCGAKDCRGSITGYKDLPQNFKDRYSGFIAPYLVEMDRKTSTISA